MFLHRFLFAYFLFFSSYSLSDQQLRIATLSPHLAEMVERAGGLHLLIGVSSYSNFSPAIQKLPIISDARSIDIEKIKQLNPNILLIWSGNVVNNQIKKIKMILPNILIVEFQPNTLEDIGLDLIKIGYIIQKPEYAKKAAHLFKQELNILLKKYQTTDPEVLVFYQVWTNPLMTINKNQLIHDVIAKCNGTNIFSKEKLLIPLITHESVIRANPDLIISTQKYGLKDSWSVFHDSLSANRYQGFLYIPGSLISQPTPSILQGMNMICSSIDRIRKIKRYQKKLYQ